MGSEPDTTRTRLSLLVMDTLDDRREVWTLLHRLSPRQRVAFLVWCCSRVRGAKGNGPAVFLSRMRETVELAYRCDRADLRLTNECYGDLLVISTQWGLDLAAAAVELEKWVRGQGAGAPTAAG